MDRHPHGHPAWLDVLDPDRVVVPLAPLAGDPDVPLEHPAALDDSEPEEDPEEANYEPADVPGYLQEEDSDDEGILEDIPLDDAQPEECLSEEEISVPPTPTAIQFYQPYLRGGKGPMLRTTPRVSEHTQPDIYSFVDRPIGGHGWMSDMHRTLPDITPFLTCGQKRKAPEGPAHYELGESSQAPPPAVSASEAQIGLLTDRVRALEDHIRYTQATSRTTIHRVEALEEEERQDTEAIRTLYHRGNATRTDVINLQIRSGHLENTENVTQAQLSAAERTVTELRGENRQLREQFDELVRYLTARFGR